jgi:hypothetical protein
MKKTKFFWLLPIMVIIFLASACASPTEVVVEEEEFEHENGQDQEIMGENREFETLFQTFDSRHEEEMFYIIGDEETFTDLWVNKLEEEMFEVDFDEKMVLAVFLGEKPSGGYNVEITEIIETDTTLEVMVNETIPGEDDMVTMALTYPSHVVMLDKCVKEVVFNMHK